MDYEFDEGPGSARRLIEGIRGWLRQPSRKFQNTSGAALAREGCRSCQASRARWDRVGRCRHNYDYWAGRGF
jgi:hypothetical protein